MHFWQKSVCLTSGFVSRPICRPMMMTMILTMMMMTRTVNLKRVHFSGNLSAQDCARVSVAAEMTEVSTFLASCLVPLPLLSAKKTSCQKKQKLCPHHKISCILATFVSIKICSYALNLFSVQIPNNIKSTFNPTI